MSTFTSFGRQLARWRRARGLSQLRLALEADISTRHLGFLEVGRAQPSRAMIARLAAALQLGGAQVVQLYLAAGFVPGDECGSAGGGARRGHLALAAMEAALAIHRATPRDAAAIAVGFTRELGITHAATAVLARQGDDYTLAPDPGGEPPVAWLQRYAEQGYVATDPIVQWNFAGPGLFHSARLDPARLSVVQRRMLGEAAEHGLRFGVTLPLRRPDGAIRSFCGWTDALQADDLDGLTALRLVASAWLETLEARQMPERAQLPLG